MAASGHKRSHKDIDSPRRAYVSYLTTEAICDCLDDIERRLIDINATMSPQTRSSYKAVHNDLLDELAARQLAFEGLG